MSDKKEGERTYKTPPPNYIAGSDLTPVGWYSGTIQTLLGLMTYRR